MAPLSCLLFFLATIFVFAVASKTFGKSQGTSTVFIDVSRLFNEPYGKLIQFNKDHKFDVVIDQVNFLFMEDCATFPIFEGGPGKSYLRVLIVPTAHCGFGIGFSVVVEGRALSGSVAGIKEHFSFNNAYYVKPPGSK